VFVATLPGSMSAIVSMNEGPRNDIRADRWRRRLKIDPPSPLLALSSCALLHGQEWSRLLFVRDAALPFLTAAKSVNRPLDQVITRKPAAPLTNSWYSKRERTNRVASRCPEIQTVQGECRQSS
jgi:hypothetical protein